MLSLVRILFFMVAALVSGSAQTWDLLIPNGLVIDGSGRSGVRATIAVKDARIAAINPTSSAAQRVVDATGLVVAPGFIDVHTHAEGILGEPNAENFLRMGVTTLVVGNCGASEVDLGKYLRAVELTKVSANVATLIGHNAVRTKVMGASAVRTATEAELGRMRQLVEQAMQDGALGFSTGLIYSPAKYAATNEIIELAKVASAHGGIYATHVRDEQEGLIDSLNEAFETARAANIRLQISHLKLSGNLISPQKPETIAFLEQARLEGFAEKVVAALDMARKGGLRVSQDLYPYSAATASLHRLLPPRALASGSEELRKRLRDPNQRTLLAEQMKSDLRKSGHTNYAHAVIVTSRRFKQLQGLTILQAAGQRRQSTSLDAQIQTILDLAVAGDVSIILYDLNEADLVPLMKLPDTMFISDSGTFQLGNEMEHPRGYGSAARILARYVREGHTLTLEEAIRKMTALPASTFRLKDRGEIRVGAWADLVIFDPATVQDQANYAAPHTSATGFKHVFVNGVETVRSDQHTGAREGRPLRRGL